mgnify:CR=1 FL=1
MSVKLSIYPIDERKKYRQSGNLDSLYTLRSRGGIFMKEIKTRHLILWRGTEYEVDAFMKMLRDEGDFEWFTGIEYSEAG